MVYSKKESYLGKFIITYALFYSFFFIVFLVLFNLKMALIVLATMIFSPLFLYRLNPLFFSVLRFIWESLSIQYVETSETGINLIYKNDRVVSLSWSQVENMKFRSGSYSGLFEFYGGKKFGYYELTGRGVATLKLHPTVQNLDDLVREIIKYSHLKKKSATSMNSFLGRGDFAHWERSNDPQTEDDLDVSPRQISSFKNYFVVFIVVILLIAIALWFNKVFLGGSFAWE